MKKPDISIGMLTWNRAPMLETCLEKLFKSLDPALSHQIVIMDNGSTDSTPSLLRQFSEEDGRVLMVFMGAMTLRMSGDQDDTL